MYKRQEELLRQRELQAEEAAAEAAKLEEGAADILIEEEEMLFDAEELDAAQAGQLSEDIREVEPEESEE